LLLAGVERVRLRGDLDLVDRILLAVLPLDRFVGRDRRAGHEAEIAAGVEKHDLAVVGVDAVFHGVRLVGGHGLTFLRAVPGKPRLSQKTPIKARGCYRSLWSAR